MTRVKWLDWLLFTEVLKNAFSASHKYLSSVLCRPSPVELNVFKVFFCGRTKSNWIDIKVGFLKIFKALRAKIC
mgnify:CR=1 FL=1